MKNAFAQRTGLLSLHPSRGIAMRGLLAKFIGDRKAATAIECGLIAALIAIAMIAGLNALGSNINSQLAAIGTSLN